MRTKLVITKNGTKRIPFTDEENKKRDKEESEAISESKREALVRHRYAKENEGVQVRGMLMQTDRETRATLLGARLSADKDKKFTADWKSLDGFVSLDYMDIIEVYEAVQAHITKCFSAEHAVLKNIENYSTVEDVRNAFDAEFAK